MTERDVGRHLAPDVFLQNVFHVERGRMVRFTLQIEVLDEGRWHPVIRCDTVHGEAHLDYLTPDGEEYNKTWLGVTAPYNAIHARMVQEFTTTYQAHIRRWFRQKGLRP